VLRDGNASQDAVVMSSVNRLDRVNTLLRREIAEAFYKVFAGGGYDIDLAALTVMRVECAVNLRNANVYISVFGHEDLRGRWMRMLREHAGDVQKLVNSHMTLKYTPRLHFHLDEGVEKGDHVLELLFKMDHDGEHAPDQE